jgi:hypothetical protein
MFTGFKTTAERTVYMLAEFINNEIRLDGQELPNDDNMIQNQTIMGCDM